MPTRVQVTGPEQRQIEAFQEKAIVEILCSRELNDPAIRGGQISGHHRNFRSHIKLLALTHIANKEGLDMTPTLAYRLCQRLFGSGMRMDVLIEVFGSPGRTAADVSPDFAKIDPLALHYEWWAKMLVEDCAAELRDALNRAIFEVNSYRNEVGKKDDQN